MGFLKVMPFVGLAYLWPACAGEKAVELSFLVLLLHLMMFRALGLYITVANLFEDIKLDGLVEAEPEKFWNYLLQPLLDTENSEDEAIANSSLKKMGFEVWQIKTLRFLNGIGFGLSFIDEWIEFSYQDFVCRWLMTLMLDGLISVLFLIVWREVGIAFSTLWILEAIIFLGLKSFQQTST